MRVRRKKLERQVGWISSSPMVDDPFPRPLCQEAKRKSVLRFRVVLCLFHVKGGLLSLLSLSRSIRVADKVRYISRVLFSNWRVGLVLQLLLPYNSNDPHKHHHSLLQCLPISPSSFRFSRPYRGLKNSVFQQGDYRGVPSVTVFFLRRRSLR